MPVVVSRLINARRHLLALRIATLLGMGPEKVLALPRVSVKEHGGLCDFCVRSMQYWTANLCGLSWTTTSCDGSEGSKGGRGTSHTAPVPCWIGSRASFSEVVLVGMWHV